MRAIKIWLGLLPALLLAFIAPSVYADNYTVPMQILENGSNNTSYAAAYFAHSATVTPSGNHYVVSNTITTDTSLGDWPVQVYSVDGQGVSISKSQNGNSQMLTYSFTTTDLSARHNANIRVDVDSIDYHHNYTVGLVMSAGNVPALTPATAAEASTTAASSAAPVATSQTHTSSSATASSAKSEANATTSTSAQSQTADASQSGSTSQAKKKHATKKATKAKPTAKQATEQNLPIIPMLAGGLVFGAAAAGLTILIQRKKH